MKNESGPHPCRLILKKILFILAALGLSRCMWGSLVTAHGLLSSCAAWALELTGSVVEHGLSCSVACGILVP